MVHKPAPLTTATTGHGSALQRLFPTKTSFAIFWSYISLFVSQGLLVKAVHQKQILGFNSIIMVLLTEFVKLTICIGVYLFRSHGNVSGLVKDAAKNHRLILLYLVPSFLYCLYNNLTYINLELFDLTTYYCMMQFRIVVTAIIYQILFRRKLTSLQWVSLLILTVGCVIKEYGMYANSTLPRTAINQNSTSANDTALHPNDRASTTPAPNDSAADGHGVSLLNFIWLTSLLLLQMFCSSFAGVYNEFLLKETSTANSADIILQNIFMYFDSILCNLVVYKIAADSDKNKDSNIGAMAALRNLLASSLVITLVLNNAISGLVASFFLKSLNSILKTFASALELFAIALLAWFVFGTKVDSYTMVALVLVTAALFLYSKNPVSTAPPGRTTENDNQKLGFVLLRTTDEDDNDDER